MSSAVTNLYWYILHLYLLLLNHHMNCLKTTVHEFFFFLHPCTDNVCNNTPAKSHLQTPARKHIKSQLNLTLGKTNRSLSETVPPPAPVTHVTVRVH